MSILVFIESDNNNIKKSSFEAIAYATKLGEVVGKDVNGVSVPGIETASLSSAGGAGLTKVYQLSSAQLVDGNEQAFASAVAKAAEQLGSTIVIMAHSSFSEATSSRLAIKLNASVATNVIGLPDVSNGFAVTRSVYTSKAFTKTNLLQANKVITLKKNAFAYEMGDGSAQIEDLAVEIPDSDLKVTIKETKKQEGDILLPEAELVVSAGRGLKGPENWGMVEELASVLKAGTACSKPVSDMDWRPHHEHVGQTGIKISPNLYIAIGISGAIQHLAGVSSSKVIVVINTDSEAPFFKAADYGIVGDAFEVVPKFIEALKKSI